MQLPVRHIFRNVAVLEEVGNHVHGIAKRDFKVVALPVHKDESITSTNSPSAQGHIARAAST
jgi:hypothetical protein